MESQLQMFMPDIPRIYTALAEWMACMFCIHLYLLRCLGEGCRVYVCPGFCCGRVCGIAGVAD